MGENRVRSFIAVVLSAVLTAIPFSVAQAGGGDGSMTSANLGSVSPIPSYATLVPPPYLTMKTPPARGSTWPLCVDDMQAYCVTTVIKIDANGNESSTGVTPFSNCHNNDMTLTSPCRTDGFDWIEVGVQQFPPGENDYTYRWTIRTGLIHPTILMLGDTQKTHVTYTDTVGWSIEIWAKPALKVYKEGCVSVRVCGDKAVAEDVRYQISGYLKMLGISDSYTSVESVELRDSLAGTFISTNGMSQSWDFSSDTFTVDAFSPHFLPDGVTVTPGFVKVFLPAAYILGPRGYSSLESAIQKGISVSLKQKQAPPSFTLLENGILVDTGVRHFSNPRPKVKVKAVQHRIPKNSKVKLSTLYKTTKNQKAKWRASGACAIRGKTLVTRSSGQCNISVQVLQKRKYILGLKRNYKIR